jgi:hypothetical protein
LGWVWGYRWTYQVLWDMSVRVAIKLFEAVAYAWPWRAVGAAPAGRALVSGVEARGGLLDSKGRSEGGCLQCVGGWTMRVWTTGCWLSQTFTLPYSLLHFLGPVSTGLCAKLCSFVSPHLYACSLRQLLVASARFQPQQLSHSTIHSNRQRDYRIGQHPSALLILPHATLPIHL